MNRFEPIEPDLVESAHMAVLRMKEAALNELAHDLDIEPSVLLALSDSAEADPLSEDTGDASEILQKVLEAVTPEAIDEPLAEEQVDVNEEADFDPWASELLGS